MIRSMVVGLAMCFSIVFRCFAESDTLPCYTVTDLGVLADSQSSRAFGINDARVIVGESTENFLTQHPCVWIPVGDGNGVVVYEIAAISCCDDGIAIAISSNGYIAIECGGSASVASIGGECDLLGECGGPYAAPYAINASGKMVGYALDDSYRGYAFLWSMGGVARGARNGCMLDLFPRVDFAVATDVNDAGIIVGFLQGTGGENVAFMRADNGAVTFLPTLGGAHASAAAVSGNGMIVGISTLALGASHACMWRRATDGGLVALDLAAPPPLRSGQYFFETTSEAYDVNNRGEVIGAVAVGASTEPFIWTQRHGMHLLNDLLVHNSPPNLSPQLFRLERVVSINNHGDIVGWGTFGVEKELHAVFLTLKK